MESPFSWRHALAGIPSRFTHLSPRQPSSIWLLCLPIRQLFLMMFADAYRRQILDVSWCWYLLMPIDVCYACRRYWCAACLFPPCRCSRRLWCFIFFYFRHCRHSRYALMTTPFAMKRHFLSDYFLFYRCIHYHYHWCWRHYAVLIHWCHCHYYDATLSFLIGFLSCLRGAAIYWLRQMAADIGATYGLYHYAAFMLMRAVDYCRLVTDHRHWLALIRHCHYCWYQYTVIFISAIIIDADLPYFLRCFSLSAMCHWCLIVICFHMISCGPFSSASCRLHYYHHFSSSSSPARKMAGFH